MNRIVIFLLFPFIFLCSCGLEIKDTIYVASIGLSYEDELVVYLYVAESSDIGVGGETKDNKVAKLKGESLSSILIELDNSTSQKLNYAQLRSVIMHKSYVSYDNLLYLTDSLKNQMILPMNFYLFITDSDIEDIYSMKNPDETSTLYSVFTNPRESNFYNMVSEKIHYAELVRTITSDTKYLRIPYLKINEEIWKSGDEDITSVYIAGSCFGFSANCVDAKIEKRLVYLFNQEKIRLEIEDSIVDLNDFKHHMKYENGKINVYFTSNVKVIKRNKNLSYEELDKKMEIYLYKEITELLEKFFYLGIDPLEARDFLLRQHNLKVDFNFLNGKYQVFVRIKPHSETF